MDAGGIIVSLAFAAFGGAMAARPYPFARFSERVDAIGSTTSWTRVEPADWMVLLTRIAGLVVVALGLLAAYGAYTA